MFYVLLAAAALLSGLAGYLVGGHLVAFVFTLVAALVGLGGRDIVRHKHAFFAGTLLTFVVTWYLAGLPLAVVASLLAFSLQIAIHRFTLRKGVLLPLSLIPTFVAWWIGWQYGDSVTGLASALITFLVQVGVNDFYIQRSHSVRRNWPLIGWCRYGFELIGDELRQYWFRGDMDGWPNRLQAQYVYRSAKGINNNLGFGTQRKYRDVGEIHILNTMYPIAETVSRGNRLPPLVIGKKRRKPYHCPWPIAISGMSWGALSAEAVMALSSGAKEANIHIMTGEGGLTPYHIDGVVRRIPFKVMMSYRLGVALHYLSCNLRAKPSRPVAEIVGGGRIGLQLGPAKFGFRKFFLDPFDTAHGQEFRKRWTNELDWDKIRTLADNDQIVLVEVKLAQGAKPGQGGKLPKEKVTPELAEWRGIPLGEDCYSPNAWDEFNDTRSMFKFIKDLQEATGKPVGIKIVVGQDKYIHEIAQLMKETGEGPDFITIDGGEGGTGAAPVALADRAGLPILHSIPLVDTILRKHGVRNEVILIASGQILDGADIAIAMAMGADMVNRGRGNMVAEGCILAFRCHTNTCPVGVATQDPRLRRGLDPEDKYAKVANYNLVGQRELLMMCRTAGVQTPWELTRHHLSVVVSPMVEKSLAEIHPYPDSSEGKRNLLLGELPPDCSENNDRMGPKLIQIGSLPLKRK